MIEEYEEEGQGGVGSGILLLFVGLMIPLFFNTFTQGQDSVVFLIVLTGIGGVVLYGESLLAMPNGVALGAGVLLASIAAYSWWLAGLGIASVVVSLGKYASSDLVAARVETESIVSA